jgi:hypothetical protein
MLNIFATIKEWRRKRAWAKLSPRDKRLCQLLGNMDVEGRPLREKTRVVL